MANKSNKKRIAASLAATALVSTLAIGGATLAYLTDSETVTNTFTVGDIKIELLEPNYPGNDNDEEVKDLVPNEEVDKDPKIVNRGVNDTIMFMVLDSPMEAITLINDDGTPVYTQDKTQAQSKTAADGSTVTENVTYEIPQRKVDEIFWFKDAEDEASDHANNFDSNWTQLPAKSMYIIKDRFGNETQVVFTDDSATDTTNDLNSDLDDTTLDQNLYTGSQRIFPTEGLDATNKLTKRQAALQALYASLPADSTLVHRYVFAYNVDTQGSTLNDDDQMKEAAKLGDAASARETTTLFEKVQLKNFIEDELDKTTQSIEIRAYAIQDSELLEESADLGARLNAGTLNATDLNHIYDMFVNQNSEVVDGENLRIINMREADSVQNTAEGEFERKNDGSFEDPTVDHTNRWDTDDEVGASDDQTADQPNVKPAP